MRSDVGASRTGRRAAGARWAALALGCIALLGGTACDRARDAEERSILLATTTSVRDSGLLDALLPAFRERTGIEVRVVAVGTGAALRMGREGNADVLLTHAPSAEQALVDDGVVRRRTPFMENHFVIAGPADDPAGVAAADSPADALRRIAAANARWVSRADDSGTHKREKALAREAGLDPERPWPAVLETGSGMGASLQVAGEKRAYILSDIGTYLAFEPRIGLVVLSRPAPALRNVYSVLQLDAERLGRPIDEAAVEAFEAYLVEPGVQERIAAFGRERFGRSLFAPIRSDPAHGPAT